MSAEYWIAWALVTAINIALFVASYRLHKSNRRLLSEAREHLEYATLGIESRRAVLSYCSTLRGLNPSPATTEVLDRIERSVAS